MSKKLKGTAALILSGVLLVCSMGMSAFAKPSYGFETNDKTGLVPVKEVMFEENFSDPNLGVLNAVWGKDSTCPLTVISRTGNSDSSQGYLVINNVGTDQYYKTKSENPLKGKFAIEFKFQKNTNNTPARTLFAAGYVDGENEYTAIKFGIDEADKPYFIDGNGNRQMFINNSKTWTAGYDIHSYWSWAENEWYTFKVAVDTENAKYNVYLNGCLCVKNADFISSDGHNWKESGINLPYIMAAEYENGQDFCYDDLYIYSEVSDRESIYANDFNSYDSETVWSGSSSSNCTGVAGLGIAAFKAKGGMIKATDGKLITVYESEKGGAFINGLVADDEITVDTDFTVDSFTEDGKWATVIALVGSSNSDGIRFAVNKDGKLALGFYNRGISETSKVADITLGEQHHLTLHADFRTYKCDLYIDGTAAVTGQNILSNPSYNGNSNYLKNGEGFAIGLGYANSSPTTNVTYDNFTVYRDKREEVLSVIPSALSEIFPGNSLIMKQVTLPSEIAGYEGYNLTWSADENANIKIAEDGKTASVTQTKNNQFIKLTATVSDENGEYSVKRSFTVKVYAGPNVGHLINDADKKTVTANGRQTPSGSVLILAVYKDNALTEVVTANTISNNTIQAVWDYSSAAEGNYQIKAMLLGSISSFAPLCIPADSIDVTVAAE